MDSTLITTRTLWFYPQVRQSVDMFTCSPNLSSFIRMLCFLFTVQRHAGMLIGDIELSMNVL